MQIRDVSNNDLDAVLALNEASVPHVNSIDRAQMEWFAQHAPYFRVATLADGLAGFLIGLLPGQDYASLNYRWFNDHYERFAYIDRVAVAANARRLRIASHLYDDFGETMREHADVLTCEVNLRPPNPSSMAYHLRYGFVQVGSQATEGGSKEVALLEKTL